MSNSGFPDGSKYPSRLTASWYTCGCGKRGYFNRASARNALRWTRRRLQEGQDQKKLLHIYRCPTGNGFYHIGHSHRWGADLNARFED